MDERPEEAEKRKKHEGEQEDEAGAGGAGEPLLGLIWNSAAHPEVTGLYIVHMSCMLFYESRTHKSIDISLCTASQRT